MPCPVSATRISASEPAPVSVTSTRPLAGVNLIALDRRFATTCWRRTASPVAGLGTTGQMKVSPTTFTCAAGWAASTAACATATRSTGSGSMRILPPISATCPAGRR
jgi:hypothetical protein